MITMDLLLFQARQRVWENAEHHAGRVGEDQLQLDRPGHLPVDPGGPGGAPWQRLQLKSVKSVHSGDGFGPQIHLFNFKGPCLKSVNGFWSNPSVQSWSYCQLMWLKVIFIPVIWLSELSFNLAFQLLLLRLFFLFSLCSTTSIRRNYM